MYRQTKAVLAIMPASFTNGATATGMIDTLGYDQLNLDIIQATSNAVTNNLSVCKLAEADVTTISSASDITEFVGDGAGGFTVPNADTSDPQLYKLNVDLRARKRYLFLSLSPVTTQILGAVANLDKGKEAPISATDANVAVLVEG